MLQIVSALLGFFAPFLPQVVKLFQQKIDNAHELAMMKLRLEMASQEHLWRMEEINTQADIAESYVLHRPQQSFGVQILDAAKESKMSNWTTVPVFWMFSLLDAWSASVRPNITYAMFAFYAVTKFAQYQIYVMLTDNSHAIASLWTENDWAVLLMCGSYWLGMRSAKAAFGGSASNGRQGA